MSTETGRTSNLIPKGRDPRGFLKAHRERGPKTWRYGVAVIASIVGLKPATVREHARRGSFNPADLVSVCEYIAKHRAVISFPRG